MSYCKQPASPPSLWARLLKQITLSYSSLSFLLWTRISLVNVSWRNPHIHLHNFLAKYDTIKLNGVSANTIKFMLFPFSLKVRASDWLKNPTPSPPGRPYQKPSLVSTSCRARSLSWVQKWPFLLNKAISLDMKHDQCSRMFNANVPTKEYPTGS